jgi:16S rRNA pseudouridine516 synthase
MFEAVGNRVVFLKRIRIGNLDLDENLALGECLEIMHKDVEKLLCQKF